MSKVKERLSEFEKANKFKLYIESEIDLFEKYFNSFLSKYMKEWGSLANSIMNFINDNAKHKVIETGERKDFRGELSFDKWKELIEKKVKKTPIKYSDIEIREDEIQINKLTIPRKLIDSLIRIKFLSITSLKTLLDKIPILLNTYHDKFKIDYHKIEQQIVSQDRIKNIVDESILRLSIWSSVYTNDEYGKLSPFGPYMIVVGEAMDHHPIGIIDAFDQMLWSDEYTYHYDKEKEKYTDKKFLANLWRIDLIRAQLLTLAVFEELELFILKAYKKSNRAGYFDLLVANWNESLEKYIKNTFELQEIYEGENEDSQRLDELKYENSLLEKKFKNVQTIVEGRKITDINFVNKYSKLLYIIDDDVQTLKKKFISSTVFASDILKATFRYVESNLPPLIQLIEGNASAWSSDDEVPAIIVINKKLATSSDQTKRLKAYAAVPHELGHIVADTFREDGLVEQLKSIIRSSTVLEYKDMWCSWISEIFADFFAVGLFCENSILGLIYALKEGNYLPHMILVNDDDLFNEEFLKYDRHPNPLIRVKLTLELLRKLKVDIPKMPVTNTEMDRIERQLEIWKKQYLTDLVISAQNYQDLESSLVGLELETLHNLVYFDLITVYNGEFNMSDVTKEKDKIKNVIKNKAEFNKVFVNSDLYDEVRQKNYPLSKFKKDIVEIVRILTEDPIICLGRGITITSFLKELWNDSNSVFRKLTKSYTESKINNQKEEDEYYVLESDKKVGISPLRHNS